MRVSSFISIGLAAVPAVVSAAGTFGYALGAKNADGSCKSTTDYESDFDALKGSSSLVRIYAASQCNTSAEIIPAAKSKSFKVMLGVWPDTEESFNADVQALQATVPGNEDVVYAITVGSETLYRGNFTGEELLGKIQSVQNLFPSVTVGTADSWNKYADGTADALIKGGVKLLLVNAFAYWQSQKITNATATYFDDIMQALGHIQEVSGCIDCIHVMNGETGWPTDGGSNYGVSIAGTDNAKTFYQQGVCAMLDWGVDVFYFEAFDEPWKPASVGDDGAAEDETHWGAFTADRTAKFDLSC